MQLTKVFDITDSRPC